ncbi:hypothetical protein Tco_0182948, partial [Tanacetum coccineum]
MLDFKVIRGDFRNNYRILVPLGGLAVGRIIKFLWEDYQVSQDWMIQQKFFGLAVVDLYGLEN